MEAKAFMSLLLILFLSCNMKSTVSIKESEIPIHEQWHVGLSDTVLTEVIDDKFIRFLFSGDTIYRIEWGNKHIKNVSTNQIEVLGNGVLGVLDKDEKAIVLSQTCGTNCRCFVILPILADHNERKYFCALTYDFKTNIIAYVPEGNNLIRFENIFTGQTWDLVPWYSCSAVFIEECIDTIRFKNDYIMVDWKDPPYSTKDEQGKSMKIEIGSSVP